MINYQFRRGVRRSTDVQGYNGRLVSGGMTVDKQGVDRWGLSLMPFADYGRARDYDDALSSSSWTQLRSIGLELRWAPVSWFDGVLSWGHAFDDDEFAEPADYDLQDDGWHVALRFSYPR